MEIFEMQTLDRTASGDPNVLTLYPDPAPAAPPPARPDVSPGPARPVEVEVTEAIRLPLGFLALVGAAGVVFLQAPPIPFGGWLLLSVLYFVVETALAGKGRPFGEAGWPALVAMVPLLAPEGVVLGATVTALVAGIVHRARFGEPFSVCGRFLAHVPAVTAGAAFLVLVPIDSAWVMVVAGVVAGSVVHLQRWALPRTTGRPGPVIPAHLPVWWEPVEMAGLGGAAAMTGGLLAASGWVAAPIATAALLLVVAADHLRGEEVRARRASIDSLLLALEAKDLYTRGHCERVAALAVEVGRSMRLSRPELHLLETAALLHDVGKLAVDRSLLRKRGRLTLDEYRRVQGHNAVVGDVLGDIGFLGPAIPVVVDHHRHFDGTPYGDGADTGDGPAGSDLSIQARILAVADAYDAMTTHRPYRRALTRRYAFLELRRCGGTQFDPDVVEALIEVVHRTGTKVDACGFESDEVARQVAEREASHA
jgi:hypothetical protein